MPKPDNEVIRQIADKHDVSVDAVTKALEALRRGGGGMAQFSHADFGGMAQWSSGGMSMVGDMFNTAMKSKLNGVMADLAAALGRSELASGEEQATKPGGDNESKGWWPQGLGHPSSSGSQNDMRYAFFPESKRLVVEDRNGRITYDTGSHYITGVSQQQGEERKLAVTGQGVAISLSDLQVV